MEQRSPMPVAFKILIGVLVVSLLGLQWRLWIGEGSLAEVAQLSAAIGEQHEENAALEERNRRLRAEVKDLKDGLNAVEARARSALGMIRKDETFYLVVDGQAAFR